ncbi:hypothetical protein [Mesorhizobium sp. SP-1A]|uniref:hypothetical protein n=1 Tax=Mesorhizobium sp. SP-1A TaxID=3077840 RepID=UPI0028F71CD4|nr:hypothetical protein [Mesorhizobium sp. SP-1A]
MTRLIATQISLAALFAGLLTMPAMAADKCYQNQKVFVPAEFKCSSNGGSGQNRFDDFSNGSCQKTDARYDDVEVEVPCPKVGKWVNATFTNKTITVRNGGRDGGTTTQTISVATSQAETCASVGLKPAKLEDKYICASGEDRPTRGTDYNKIKYKYGTWGGTWGAGVSTTVNNYTFCWASGQKKDNDATDRVVAWYCE